MGKILVIWNHRSNNLSVLQKAANLIKHIDKKAVVVTFINDLPSSEESCRSQIETIQSQVNEQFGHSLIAESLVVRGNKAKWIIDYCSNNEISLVIKPWDRTHETFFTATDWELIRHLPTNLLLAKSSKWKGYKKVLAALKIDIKSKRNDLLNHRILQNAVFWRDTGADSTVHTVACIPMNQLLLDMDIKEQIEVEQKKKPKYIEALDRLVKLEKIQNVEHHVKAGVINKIIAEVSNTAHADLTVIGSEGRRGISTLYLGNVAEKVLKPLRSDILIIRK